MAFAALFVLIPTVAMGGTLPILTRGLVRSGAPIGPSIARLYFVNTIGAAAGAARRALALADRGRGRGGALIALGNIGVGLVAAALALAPRVEDERTLRQPSRLRREARCAAACSWASPR